MSVFETLELCAAPGVANRTADGNYEADEWEELVGAIALCSGIGMIVCFCCCVSCLFNSGTASDMRTGSHRRRYAGGGAPSTTTADDDEKDPTPRVTDDNSASQSNRRHGRHSRRRGGGGSGGDRSGGGRSDGGGGGGDYDDGAPSGFAAMTTASPGSSGVGGRSGGGGDDYDQVFTSQELDKLKAAFRKFDADDSGTLYAIEVLQAAESIDSSVDALTVKKVFEEYDIDHSGGLDLSEFVKMFGTCVP